jgi:hypothetical protein
MRASRTPAVVPPVSSPGETLRSHGLDAKVVHVTPKLASEWLKKNTANRKPKRAAIDRYGRDMANGDWSLTGEAIIFDTNDVLRNGQNRLLACVESDAAFDAVVMWGVDPNAFKNMDRGALRTNGDVLGLNGESMPRVLASSLALLLRWDRNLSLNGGGVSSPTAGEAENYLTRFPEIREAVTNSSTWRKAGPNLGITSSLAAYIYFRLARVEASDAEVFFEAVFTQAVNGVGLNVGHPAKALGTSLVNARSQRRKLSNEDIVVMFFKAWNKWRAGGTAETIRRVSGERLPDPQ